jgi:dolichyl-diphosphooligosaccharide--protein glycosyltransferase
MEPKESESPATELMSAKEIQTRFKNICKFTGKYALLIVLILAIGLQFVPNGEGTFPWGGIYMRMQAQDLPITEQWAQQSIMQGIRQQVTNTVNQQYPNLPQVNKKKLIEEQFQEFINKAKSEIETQKKVTSNQIKEQFMYESDGENFVYMPDIDTYYYLRGARNILEKGHSYDELKDGVPWDNHAIAPIGRSTKTQGHSMFMVFIHKVISVFNPKTTLMESVNYFPIILIILSLIPAFFLGRRLAGKIGGFFSVTMLAILPAIMARTPWGHADTDAYSIFFPILTIWFVMEMILAKKNTARWCFAGLAGLSLGLYSKAWSHWEITFYFIFFAFIAYGLAILAGSIINYVKNGKKDFHALALTGKLMAAFVASTLVFIIALNGLRGLQIFFASIKSIFNITSIKQAAHSTLWPNVFTTVAELNPGSFNAIIGSLGGKVFFFLALLGVFLLITENSKRKLWYGGAFLVWFFITTSTQSVFLFIAGLALLGFTLVFEKANYAKAFCGVLMLIWFGGTVYASLKGIRFTLLAGPAFAIAFGSAIGIIAHKASKWADKQLHINKIITTTLIIVLVGLLLMNPISGKGLVKESYKRASGDIPLVNDAWWDVLTQIKEESQPNAIINSWWDFGHHFKYIADRAVTFDGGSQNSPMAHWIGKTLQTDNEKEAVGTLRMLDCGSNTAYEKMLNKTHDIHKSLAILKQIILLDKNNASQVLTDNNLNPDEILPYTHCDPPENYFITSADMTGKAGVWGHFGLWDFAKADIWKNYKKLPRDTAIQKMVDTFGYSEEKAERLYDEVQALESEKEANTWISPWPTYQGGNQPCKINKGRLTCNNIHINASNLKAEIVTQQGKGVAYSVITPTKDGFKEIVQEKSSVKISVLLIPVKGGNYQAKLVDPLLAQSMYTRLFFLNGHGTQCFEKFAEAQQIVSGPIYVWKVDWTCSQNNTMDVFVPKTEVGIGDQVSVNYIGYLENETIFDSSLPDWKNKNITKDTPFSDEFKDLSFVAGKGQMIKGFDEAVIGMKVGDVKTITIPPEKAYGTDPDTHTLGNKTLNFKVKIASIQ